MIKDLTTCNDIFVHAWNRWWKDCISTMSIALSINLSYLMMMFVNDHFSHRCDRCYNMYYNKCTYHDRYHDRCHDMWCVVIKYRDKFLSLKKKNKRFHLLITLIFLLSRRNFSDNINMYAFRNFLLHIRWIVFHQKIDDVEISFKMFWIRLLKRTFYRLFLHVWRSTLWINRIDSMSLRIY